MTKPSAQFILDNSDLLIQQDCKIVEDTLYERCSFDDQLYKKEQFANCSEETYYLNDDSHVYRVFLHVDDYDYVTDPSMIKKLNDLFAI